jgi:multidrug efflux pump subunit AcrB
MDTVRETRSRLCRKRRNSPLPKGYGYDYGGITREENQQSGTTMIIFGICFLMIYLILSALYESFIIPFAVLLSVPCGLMGSFLFARMFGLENNILPANGSDYVDRSAGKNGYLADGICCRNAGRPVWD